MRKGATYIQITDDIRLVWESRAIALYEPAPSKRAPDRWDGYAYYPLGQRGLRLAVDHATNDLVRSYGGEVEVQELINRLNRFVDEFDLVVARHGRKVEKAVE